MHLTEQGAQIRPSATLAINELINSLRHKGEEVYHLGFGEAPFPVHPNVRKALCENAHRKRYLPTQGILPLREQIAKFYDEILGIQYSEEQIIIGPGSKMLMFAALGSLSGTLFLPAPSWVSYQHQAHFVSKEVRHIPTSVEDSYRLTPEVFEKAIQEHSSDREQQKILLLNYLCNPTGHSYSASQLKAIVEIARENNVIIMSDEIYALVSFQGEKHHSIAEFYPEGTLVFGGVSKDRSLGGYRVGVMLLPEKETNLMRAMLSVGSEVWSCVSAPIQYAAIEAYKTTPDIIDFIKDCTSIHEIVSKYIHGRLIEAGINCPEPQGAFYLFPDWNQYKEELAQKGITTSIELAQALLKEQKVASLPGSEFGMREENLCIRIALVDYDGELALQHYRQNKDVLKKGQTQFIQAIAPRLVKACNQIAGFTNLP